MLGSNTYPSFPMGFLSNLPLDSLYSYCILGSRRTIESDGQVNNMSLKWAVELLFHKQVKSPHNWSVSQRGNRTESAARSLCSLEGVLSTLTRLSGPFPSNPLWQQRKWQGRPTKDSRTQQAHTDTVWICSFPMAHQKDHLGDSLMTIVVIHQKIVQLQDEESVWVTLYQISQLTPLCF